MVVAGAAVVVGGVLEPEREIAAERTPSHHSDSGVSAVRSRAGLSIKDNAGYDNVVTILFIFGNAGIV